MIQGGQNSLMQQKMERSLSIPSERDLDHVSKNQPVWHKRQSGPVQSLKLQKEVKAYDIQVADYLDGEIQKINKQPSVSAHLSGTCRQPQHSEGSKASKTKAELHLQQRCPGSQTKYDSLLLQRKQVIYSAWSRLCIYQRQHDHQEQVHVCQESRISRSCIEIHFKNKLALISESSNEVSPSQQIISVKASLLLRN